MANHGATSFGSTLSIAHQRMESLEHAARIVFLAMVLGRVSMLTDEQRDAVLALYRGATAPNESSEPVRPSDPS